MSDELTNISRRPGPSNRPEGSRKPTAGTIRFFCPNGHQIVVPAKLAGKRGTCSRCGAAVAIPVASAERSEPDKPAVTAPPPEPAVQVPQLDDGGPAKATAEPGIGTKTRAAEGTPDFSGLGEKPDAAPGEDAPADIGLFAGIAARPVEAEPQSFAGVEGSEEPEIDGIDNPTAVLMLKLFSECSADSAVELHLKSGQIVMPVLFDFKWSRGTHGVFATPDKADESVTLIAVAWDSVEQVIVRKMPGLPEGMFE